MKRIYVGNLGPTATADLLASLFQDYGAVKKAGIICDPVSGKSRGFGFVLMKNDSEGDEAINQLNHRSVNGSTLYVQEALPPGEERSWSKRPMRGRP